jgi:hypothetical protein
VPVWRGAEGRPAVNGGEMKLREGRIKIVGMRVRRFCPAKIAARHQIVAPGY